MPERLFYDFNSYLRGIFGCRVQKISLDAGLTCPNRDGRKGRGGCIYCNSKGSGTGLGKRLSISQQIERARGYLKKRYKAKKFLAYFQSFSNTYAPLDRLKKIYGEALEFSDVVGLCIGTRPDCVEDEVLDFLEEISRTHLVWMEYGLQSAHEETLSLINRGHGIKEFIDAVDRTRERKLNICVHVILGLPGEKREDMLETARFISRLDVQGVKIHLLYVIRGTPLHSMYKEGKYRCLSRQEYCRIIGEFISLLPPHMVIQRITGDPHPEELVSPLWALDKARNREAILEYMRRRDLYQGKFFTKGV